MKKIIVVILSFLLFSCGSLMAQSEYDKFLDAAREAISKGDCDRAQKQYNNYKYVTNKTDADIEYKIKKCKESKMAKSTSASTTKTQKSNSGAAPTVAKTDKQPTTGTLNGHEWVDLGLPSGTRWATCNVGASNPKDYGNYYAWGETKPKTTYTNVNYNYYSDPAVLPASADAATANWGSGWRMPTEAEFDELKDKCTWTWMSNGYKVVGPNGNYIFLPVGGRYDDSLNGGGSYGSYWSSSYIPPTKPDSRGYRTHKDAFYLDFSQECYNCIFITGYEDTRYHGRSVRAVCAPQSTTNWKIIEGKYDCFKDLRSGDYREH